MGVTMRFYTCTWNHKHTVKPVLYSLAQRVPVSLSHLSLCSLKSKRCRWYTWLATVTLKLNGSQLGAMLRSGGKRLISIYQFYAQQQITWSKIALGRNRCKRLGSMICPLLWFIVPIMLIEQLKSGFPKLTQSKSCHMLDFGMPLQVALYL